MHGTIQISPLCVKIINTPQFQRLRNIKQLGCCYYVYPGASHNRFEHSIGVYHLAGKLAQHLQKRMENDMKDPDLAEQLKDYVMTKNDLLCIEIAGLCHDLGHGPFSNLFEELFYKEPSIVKDVKVWKHEDASMDMFQHMIDANEKLKKALMDEFGKSNHQELQEIINFIKDLIIGKVGDKPAYMYEIVANKKSEIDVDKMDYFARDCHGLGMKSDFDHLRYIQNCRVMIIVDDAGEKRSSICIRDKEVHNLYELFHTRNNLFRRAYYHKVSTAVEYMVTDALVAANEVIKVETDKGETVRMSQAWKYMSAYQKLTDGVLDCIMMSKETGLETSKNLLSRIHNRDLYKCVYESPPKKVSSEEKEMTEKLKNDGKDQSEVISKQEEEIKANIMKAGQNLSKEDFMVKMFTYSYGKGTENPIKSVFFYEKGKNKRIKIEPSEVSLFLPSEVFQERIIRVYLKTNEKEPELKEAVKILKQ